MDNIDSRLLFKMTGGKGEATRGATIVVEESRQNRPMIHVGANNFLRFQIWAWRTNYDNVRWSFCNLKSRARNESIAVGKLWLVVDDGNGGWTTFDPESWWGGQRGRGRRLHLFADERYFSRQWRLPRNAALNVTKNGTQDSHAASDKFEKLLCARLIFYRRQERKSVKKQLSRKFVGAVLVCLLSSATTLSFILARGEKTRFQASENAFWQYSSWDWFWTLIWALRGLKIAICSRPILWN